MVSPSIDSSGCESGKAVTLGQHAGRDFASRVSRDYEGSVAIDNAGIRSVAFSSIRTCSTGANIESQFAAVLAVHGVLNEHFGIGHAAR
jgi:hypothetical protein